MRRGQLGGGRRMGRDGLAWLGGIPARGVGARGREGRGWAKGNRTSTGTYVGGHVLGQGMNVGWELDLMVKERKGSVTRSNRTGGLGCGGVTDWLGDPKRRRLDQRNLVKCLYWCRHVGCFVLLSVWPAMSVSTWDRDAGPRRRPRAGRAWHPSRRPRQRSQVRSDPDLS